MCIILALIAQIQFLWFKFNFIDEYRHEHNYNYLILLSPVDEFVFNAFFFQKMKNKTQAHYLTTTQHAHRVCDTENPVDIGTHTEMSDSKLHLNCVLIGYLS